VLDNFGRPWLNDKSIHVVLRTTRSNANYLIATLPIDQKTYLANNQYVKGESVMYLLSQTVLNAGGLLRENYLKYSQLLYLAIQDCAVAREMRAEHYEYSKKIIKTLKSKRVSELELDFDELTGEPLIHLTAEFSHIRSASLYPEFACQVDNGLVVNKQTHKIITQNFINDENELLDLCDLQGWDVSWFHDFTEHLKSIGC